MSKKGILVVDDQPGIRLLLTDILENEGYLVKTATNGKEALLILEESKDLDLIILDYKLPIIDGREVLQTIEEKNIQIPAIIISGLAEDMVEEAENYPFVKLIVQKPFNIKDVTANVKSIIN